tara:strand:- start:613 stop:795 length:183 start_codon:yes stop_codon:yes gene_type:complete
MYNMDMNYSQLMSTIRTDINGLIDNIKYGNPVEKDEFILRISQVINDNFERQNAVKRGKL